MEHGGNPDSSPRAGQAATQNLRDYVDFPVTTCSLDATQHAQAGDYPDTR